MLPGGAVMDLGGDYHKRYPFATATDEPNHLTGPGRERPRPKAA